MAQRGLTEDVLFLACTRPAMWQGVPIEAAGMNMMMTTMFFVIMHNPCYSVIGIVAHYIIRAFIARDYNIFSVLSMWTKTKGRATNATRWGGSSVSPLPLRPARNAREVRINV